MGFKFNPITSELDIAGGGGTAVTKADLVAGDGVSVSGTGKILDANLTVTNTDRGSSAVTTHEGSFIHSDIALNTTARHSHSNKATLDTYTQTEVDLADAVSKKHTHSNKTALDAVTGVNTGDQDLTTINAHLTATNNPHSVTATQVGLGNVPNLDTTNAVNKAHDAVTVSDSSTIDFTLTGQQVTGAVIDNSSNQKVAILKAGSAVGTRKAINIIDGTNVSTTVEDDNTNDRVNITLTATAGSGGYSIVQEEGSGLTARGTLNFIGSGLTAVDDSANSRTNVTLDSTATPTASKVVISDGSGKIDGWVSDATTSVKGKASFNTDNFAVTSGDVTIKDAGVSYTEIQNATGYSVVGKETTGAGANADIVAGSNGVLRRSGTGNLSFGTIVAGNIASNAVTTAKISNNNVTLAKVETIASNTVLGNNTAGTTNPSAVTVAEATVVGRLTGENIKDLSATEVRTLINVADGANAYTHPNHTGDVTSTGDGATTIANKAVTLAKMDDMATGSLIYRKTAGTGVPEVNSLATLKTDLGLTGTNTGDQVLPTRDSLGLDTDDTVTFANLSGSNTGDQIVPTNESGATNNFLTAYNNTTGAFSKAQPTWANINKTTSNIADITTKSHTSLTDIGTNTHTQIDSHLSSTSNPHSVTANQVLPTQTGNNGKYLTTDGTNSSWATVSGGGISWSAITADQTAVVNTGYLANKGTRLALTLPSTSAVGSVIRLAGMNAGLWEIGQNAGQSIKFGNQTTTVGITGYLRSVLTYDAVELVCIVADTTWMVVSSVGNITVN